MSSIIQDEKSISILHILNYNQIRDRLMNIIKWHDNGNNRYTLSSKDMTDPQGTFGKEVTLDINDTTGYIVTYLQGDIDGPNPVKPTVNIERYNINGGIRELSKLSNTSQSDRMFDVIFHVEKAIKKDLQFIGENLEMTLDEIEAKQEASAPEFDFADFGKGLGDLDTNEPTQNQ